MSIYTNYFYKKPNSHIKKFKKDIIKKEKERENIINLYNKNNHYLKEMERLNSSIMYLTHCLSIYYFSTYIIYSSQPSIFSYVLGHYCLFLQKIEKDIDKNIKKVEKTAEKAQKLGKDNEQKAKFKKLKSEDIHNNNKEHENSTKPHD